MFLSVALTALTLALVHWCLTGRRSSRPLKNARRVLLIIAHPDDECMFFGPTIISLVSAGADIHVLCLSSGNHRKEGLVRKVELRKSCRILGIPIGNITVIDHTRLPDDPTMLWNKGVIKQIVLRYIEQLSIDTVITFDEDGVSDHVNHRAIYKAVQHMYGKALFPPATQVLQLESVSILRKYNSFLDLLLSSLSSPYIYVIGYQDVWNAQRAMMQHRSQLTWYRVLYIIFSRYMVINTLRKIAMEEKYYRLTSPTPSEDKSPQM